MLIHDTRDLNLNKNGKSIVVKNATGCFCNACGEAISVCTGVRPRVRHMPPCTEQRYL
ncbi:YgiT-type zinc finger protein [Pusillimonas sp. T2]|uniref:YgiT-type zinc finger protein n=1 Tax=Pusillimonas sp. T2 TaxID=1548123 RepID=UPI00117B2A39